MSKVKNIISLKIDPETAEACNLAHSLNKSNISLGKSIKSQKLLNFKQLQSSLSEVLLTLKTCEQIQQVIIENSSILSNQTEKIFKFLENYSKKVFICEDLKNSHEIIEFILKRFSLTRVESLDFQELIESWNNLDLLQDEIKAGQVHPEYLERVAQVEKKYVLEVCKRIKTLVFDLESVASPSLVKFAFDLVYKKDTQKYQQLVNFTLRIRKRQTFIQTSKLKNLDFCSYFEALVDLAKKEKKKTSEILGNDSNDLISKVFAPFIRNFPKLVQKHVLSFNFYELFTCFQCVEEFRGLFHDKNLEELKEIIESRISSHSGYSIECVSGLAGLAESSALYYVRFKVAELLVAYQKLRLDSVVAYFYQVCFEIIDRVIGYFFDLSSLKAMVAALNVFELVLACFRDYPSHLNERIEDIKKKIIFFEVSEIFNQIQRFSNDFSHSFFNFYYKATQSSVLSAEINEIQSETSKEFIKFEVSKQFLQKSMSKLKISQSSMLMKPYLLQLLLV